VASRVFYLDEMGMVGDALINGSINAAAKDNAPAWNAAMAAAKYGDEYIMPAGYSGFKSRPATFPSQCRLVGRGAYSSFVKNYNSPLDEVFLRIGNSYPNLERLHFYQGYGFTGGTAWGHIASPGSDLYGLVARDITVSCFNTKWRNGVVIENRSGTPNYGTRSIYIDHLFIAAGVEGGFGLKLSGIEGGGSIDKLALSGSTLILHGDPDSRNSLLRISGGGNPSAMSIDYTLATHLDFSSIGALGIGPTCTSVVVEAAFHTATPVVLGTNNRVSSGKNEWKSAA
jgi:hypothetical protein